MAMLRDVKTLQKFAAAHVFIHNHVNQDRHLNRRDNFKQNRATALAESCQHGAVHTWHHAKVAQCAEL